MATIEKIGETEQDALSARVADRTTERRRKIKAIRTPGGLATADDPYRVASRIDRLSRYLPDVRPVLPSALAARDPAALAAAGAVLERTINTPDFVSVAYLEAGARAAHAVGRVIVRDATGRLQGYGTGSMVSPRLLLTNHHVLGDAATAAASSIEFNYEIGLNGQPLEPKLLALDPSAFFLADEQLDFALVAVAGAPTAAMEFGHNHLVAAEGKAIVGDFVTIVEHPLALMKQVALRDNRIVDVLELFLHYETDTEPGASGSPVFNDQWEVVALHHASVPAPEHQELGGFVNEGVRVSRLLAFIGGQTYAPAQKALVDEMIGPEPVITAPASRAPVGNGRPTPMGPAAASTASLLQSAPATEYGAAASAPPGPATPPPAARLTIPVELELRVRVAAAAAGPAARSNGAGVAAAATRHPVATEALVIDPDYSDRTGYDPDFLSQPVPLPTLSEALVEVAAVNTQAATEPRYVLPYHHFSIVQNRVRRLAIMTAVNIDGAQSRRLKREEDRWSFDPRIPQEEQVGYELYKSNDLDLGHLVRRLDPGWGETVEATRAPVADTFHFTNCSPQHKDFNQGSTLWQGLEDYILENAENLDFKVNVLTGPVLAEGDPEYRGVRLPRQFWKVVAMVKSSGGMSATAYLLSQAKLIDGLEIKEEEDFSFGEYETYQVPIRKVEELTGLSFGPLRAADPLETGAEALVAPRRIGTTREVIL